MSDIRQGGCLCGKARYEIDLTGHKSGLCHCKDCRKQTGSAYGAYSSVPLSQFRWITKPDGGFQASDRAVRRFCPHCGSLLTWEFLKGAKNANILTATLDDPSDIVISFELFTKDRMDWVQPIAGAQQFEEDE